MSIAIDPKTNKRWIFGGTGRYLTNADVSNTAVQSWYGIIDDGRSIVGRSALPSAPSATPRPGQLHHSHLLGGPANDMVGKQGWYADLFIAGVASGERMVSRSQHSPASCTPAASPHPDVRLGRQRLLNAIDAFSGASLTIPFFDINNDGLFDNNDKSSSAASCCPPAPSRPAA